MSVYSETMGAYELSTDPDRLDIAMIHHFLATEAYWSRNIPRSTVERSIGHSLNFGIYHANEQVGFARVISDYTTIAYLGDVFILPKYRNQGLSKWLMDCVMKHPDLQGLRRWILLTSDAHELYKKYGWKELTAPEKWMEKHDPLVYSAVEGSVQNRT